MSSGTEMPNKIEPGGAITSLHPLDPPLLEPGGVRAKLFALNHEGSVQSASSTAQVLLCFSIITIHKSHLLWFLGQL